MPIMSTLALAAALQAASPAPASAEPAPPAAAPKMECVYETPPGSNFDRKVCHTAEQWRQIQNDKDAARVSIGGAGSTRPAGPHGD